MVPGAAAGASIAHLVGENTSAGGRGFTGAKARDADKNITFTGGLGGEGEKDGQTKPQHEFHKCSLHGVGVPIFYAPQGQIGNFKALSFSAFAGAGIRNAYEAPKGDSLSRGAAMG
jgi:hypothetical protein